MTANTTDNQSPWYEAFTPRLQPFVWIAASTPKPAPEASAEPESGDADWATEAIFDCYNS